VKKAGAYLICSGLFHVIQLKQQAQSTTGKIDFSIALKAGSWETALFYPAVCFQRTSKRSGDTENL